MSNDPYLTRADMVFDATLEAAEDRMDGIYDEHGIRYYASNFDLAGMVEELLTEGVNIAQLTDEVFLEHAAEWVREPA